MIQVPIWFDIDGTLLHTTVGHGAFRMALQEVYGWEETLETVVFAGNTDLQVLLDMSERHGDGPDSALPLQHTFFQRMADFMDKGLHRDKPMVIPGAVELVRALADREDLLLGLLTGNARDCAFIKLRHVGLHEVFNSGAFGDEHADRDILADRARAGFQAVLPAEVDLASGWVVGDTPRDVQAALSIGAQCLGVASGAYSESELRACGASEVVPDLCETQRLLSLLTET